MKLWTHICFLVLATSWCSRGEDGVSDDESKVLGSSFPPTTEKVPNYTLYTSDLTRSPSLDDETEPTPPDVTAQTPLTKDNETREEDGHSTATTVTRVTLTLGVTDVSQRGHVADVTTAVPVTIGSSKPGEESQSQRSGGYLLLVLIIVVIAGLCVILYLLRRSSRTYSFDLQQPPTFNYQNESTGIFEPLHFDDLAQFDDEATDDPSRPSVGNGTTTQSEEFDSKGLKSPVEEQSVKDLGTLPIIPPVSDQLALCPLDSITLLSSDAMEEQQNENNTHASLSSSDLFVDININEPTSSDLHLK